MINIQSTYKLYVDCMLDSIKNGLSVEADLPDTVWTICCLHAASYQQVKILFNNPENSTNKLFFAVFEQFSVNTAKSQQVTGKLNQLNTPTENADTPTGQLVYSIFKYDR